MKKPFYKLILASAMALPACHQTNDVNPGTGSDSTNVPEQPAPGFGTSKARPQGTLFTYPAGIRVLDKPVNDRACQDEAVAHKTMIGEGGLVHFCISFHNTTNVPIKLEFPPKTIWIAENLDTQNGITLKRVSLFIPAQRTVLYHLNAFCINPSRASTGQSEQYESQPIVSNDSILDELVQLLATKKVSYQDFGGYDAIKKDLDSPTSPFVVMQMAVEVVASGRKISPEIRELLTALPDLK